MKCFICDRTLSPEEISFDSRFDEFDPCSTCLFEIAEVFGEGDVDSEEEIDEQLSFDELFHSPEENIP